jgi:hypothetical protein
VDVAPDSRCASAFSGSDSLPDIDAPDPESTLVSPFSRTFGDCYPLAILGGMEDPARRDDIAKLIGDQE